MNRTILRKRGIHPADYRDTVAAYVAAGFPQKIAKRKALADLDERRGGGPTRKRQPLATDPTEEPEPMDEGPSAEELIDLLAELAYAVGYFSVAERLRRRAEYHRSFSYVAGLVADRLPEPYRTTAKRIRAAQSVR